jgi:branched-chain amino acid transport system ATP-binding protein
MEMSPPLLALESLTKRFGGLTATDNVSLHVMEGEVHAVIGPNGAGKTTLVAQVSGLLAPDSGTIRFSGADITRKGAAARSHLGLARTFQITSIFREFTVFENVLIAAQAHAGHSFRFWRRARLDQALRTPAVEVASHLGLAERRDVPAGTLSHGEQRVLELAIALSTRPKLLLLDEPTAGMGLEDAERIKRLLVTLRGRYAILLVEHDMDAVFRLSDRITVMVDGRPIATGSPIEIRANEEVCRAYLGDAAETS